MSNAALAYTGGTDVFLAKYSSTGTVLWAARIAGTGTDNGNAVATDSSGNVFVTGRYSAALTLYNAGGTTGGTLTNTGATDDAFLAKYSSTGTVLMAVAIATTGYEQGFGVATDLSGNAFVTGNYSGTLGSLPYIAGQDAFLIKYSSTGTLLWAAQADAGSSNDFGRAVATDSSGNVFITGYYGAACTLYNTGGTTGATLAFTGGTQDAFLAKYSSTGTVLWAAQIAGTTTSDDVGYAVATDSSGNVFVAGFYSAALTLYNTGGGTGATLANSGSGDVFLAKYSSTGTVLWAAQIAGTGSDIGYGVATDPSGNVVVTGYYSAALSLSNAV